MVSDKEGILFYKDNYSIKYNESVKPDGSIYTHCELHIQDCDRTITLGYYGNHKESLDKVLNWIDRGLPVTG